MFSFKKEVFDFPNMNKESGLADEVIEKISREEISNLKISQFVKS